MLKVTPLVSDGVICLRSHHDADMLDSSPQSLFTFFSEGSKRPLVFEVYVCDVRGSPLLNTRASHVLFEKWLANDFMPSS